MRSGPFRTGAHASHSTTASPDASREKAGPSGEIELEPSVTLASQSRRSPLASRSSELGSPSWVRCPRAAPKGPDLTTDVSSLKLSRSRNSAKNPILASGRQAPAINISAHRRQPARFNSRASTRGCAPPRRGARRPSPRPRARRARVRRRACCRPRSALAGHRA